MRHIYLDYLSTTPLAPQVQEAMIPFLAEFHGAPLGSHWFARAAAEAIEDARGRVATLLGVQRDEVVFTSGGTESVNFAMKGIVLQRRPLVGHVVVSAVDHSCVLEVARFLESWGCDLTILPVSSQGLISPDAVQAALRPDTMLVSIPHAVADTGVIQPVRAIAEVCHSAGALLHVDAVQTVGRLSVSAMEMDADLVSISGHKMYAPKGTGALYVRHGLAMEPLLHGVGHELGWRGGVQHVAGIVGLGRAAVLVREKIEPATAHLNKLRDRLFGSLCAALGRPLPLYADGVDRIPGTLSLGFPPQNSEELLARAAEICAQPLTSSTVLAAMNVPAVQARSAIRFGLGWYTTEEEIDYTVSALASAWETLR